jgi:CheY-like chemotaxis protein
MEPLGPYPVLFVDSDSATATAAEQLMSGWGLQVSLATNAKEGIELAKTRVFDVILISLDLIDINGYKTAGIIRELGDQFKNIPIIGHGRGQLGSNGNGHVFTDFISLPFNDVELYEKLRQHLDKTRPEVVIANLDRCTDGDVEFRKELAQLLANNVMELMTTVKEAVTENDPEIFIRSVHKTKTTLSILNDSELLEQISIIQVKLKNADHGNLDDHVTRMTKRCKKTIEVLNLVSAA